MEMKALCFASRVFFAIMAAIGSSAPNDAAGFRLPPRKTYQGHALALLRPAGEAGKITLKAEADGLKSATIVIRIK
jgi:beta-galactosidase